MLEDFNTITLTVPAAAGSEKSQSIIRLFPDPS
jgi:hypothetical protein